jgi:alginate O-acetyltransferase complex protein AlgI
MLPEAAELAARVANLRGILFTEVTLAGLALALGLVAVGRWLSDEARERLVVAASLAVVVWCAGPAPTLVLVGWALAFVAVAELGAERLVARVAAGLLLAALVAGPVLAIGTLGAPRHAREFVAFGTNMVLLRAIAWARARWRAEVPRLPVGRLFLAFFFFPTFVNGPIEPAAALVRALDAPAARDVRAGLARVASGVVRIVAAALLMPLEGPAALGQGAELPALVLWAWALRLYVWFYLSFSAWTDVSIGLARLCGRRDVIENFDRPWLATDPADFWRRWHVSLGVWLRDVVYIPLGGNRRHRTLNVVAVFAVSAAWHVWGTLKLLGFGYYPVRAWIGFATWGLLHAVAVSAVRRLPPATGPALAVRRVLTFLFAAFAWVPFFTPSGVSWSGMLRMLGRMLVPFVT